MRYPDDWIMCNCCFCDRPLLSRRMEPQFPDGPPRGLEYVAGRLNDRPYCPEHFEKFRNLVKPIAPLAEIA
jgi:hypothetical protein